MEDAGGVELFEEVKLLETLACESSRWSETGLRQDAELKSRTKPKRSGILRHLRRQPLELKVKEKEKAVVVGIVRSGDAKMSEQMGRLITLCEKVYDVKVAAEETWFPALAIYGETGRVITKESIEEEDSDVAYTTFDTDTPEIRHTLEVSPISVLSRSLPWLRDALQFCRNCSELVLEIVTQLAILFVAEEGKISPDSEMRTIQFLPVWNALSELLKVLVTLDAVILSNTKLQSHWREYKSGVLSALAACKELDEGQVAFQKLLLDLDTELLCGANFETCVGQDFDNSKECEYLCGNKSFLFEFLEHIRFAVKDLTAEWKAASHETDSFPLYSCEYKLVGISSLFILYYKIAPPKAPDDVSLLNAIWQLQANIPVLLLYGRATWTLDTFLGRHVQDRLRSVVPPKDPSSFRKEYTSRLAASLPTRIPAYSRHVVLWSIQMKQLISYENDAVEMLGHLQRLIVQGLALAYRVRRILALTIALHLVQEKAMLKSVLTKSLSVCIQLLKTIMAVFNDTSALAIQLLPVAMESVKAEIFSELRSWQARLEARNATKHVERSGILNRTAALEILNQTLLGSQLFSNTRLCALRLSTNVVTRKGTNSEICKMEEVVAVERSIEKLQLLSDWQDLIQSSCDCSFLFWQTSMFFPVVLHDVLAIPMEASKLHFIVSGFCDSTALLLRSKHMLPNTLECELPTPITLFRDSLLIALDAVLLQPICHSIEDSLRLHQHAVHMEFIRDKAHPQTGSVIRVKEFLDIEPLHVVDRILCIKEAVENYLQLQFYDMTALELHDWKTYAEMRKIAKENYGLELDDSFLPQGALDTGLDVLQIMRRISVFVSLYNYNMNQQFFIERRADRGAKHLKTINVQSISDSVGTHGLGIMNTCVNFTYQFLAQAFEVFSEFLFDDNISSYLSKEMRWFSNHGDDADIKHMYPFARAFAYNRDIRKLGEPSPGVSYLTKFRQHITKIGNALGYVRMVRSAGIHWVSNNVQFVPELNSAKERELETSSPSLADPLNESAAILEQTLSDFSKKFEEETDYLSVLVNVFKQVVLSAKGTDHLKSFHMIVPALCINFVDAFILANEQVARLHKGREAYFTDDGLAVGIAYMLAILNQASDFHTLHWFKSIQSSFDSEISSYRSKSSSLDPIKDKSRYEDLLHRISQLESYKREYERLEFALSGAQIFFSS